MTPWVFLLWVLAVALAVVVVLVAVLSVIALGRGIYEVARFGRIGGRRSDGR